MAPWKPHLTQALTQDVTALTGVVQNCRDCTNHIVNAF